MNPIKIADRSKNIFFYGINICARLWSTVDFIRYKKIVSKNMVFKDKHKKERCFILGNGPSLKDLDAELLRDKYIFTVNAMIDTPLFKTLNPTYHCITDRLVYKKYESSIKQAITNFPNTQFFFHRKIYDSLGALPNTYYTYCTLLPLKNNIYIDLTKNANVYMNVVPYSIMIAMYMGFSEIILLGCDFSFFASRKDAHFYEMNKNVVRDESLFQDLFGSAIACQQYEYLYGFAQKRGIKIYNATPNSLLDVIPQVELKKLL